jgi:hypothetical protein
MDSLIIDQPQDDAADTTNALTIPKTLTAAVVFASAKGVDDVLERLKTAARAEPRDISTKKGRAALASLALKIASSKVRLDEMGKDLVADLKAQTGSVDAERRRIRDELDALKVEIRQPLTDWENAEKDRIEAFENAIAGIMAWRSIDEALTSEDLEERCAILREAKDRDWQEFVDRAHSAIASTIDVLSAEIVARSLKAAADAEAARLAEEQSERDRIERERLQAEREKQIAAEAAENAKREAEEKAARAAEVARLEHERVEREAREAAAAAETERQRIEGEKQAAIERAETAERARIEKQRVDYIRSLIDHIVDCGNGIIGGDPYPYGILFRELEEKVVIDDSFAEFKGEAIAARATALKKLTDGQERQAASARQAERDKELAVENEQKRVAAEKAAEEAEADKRAKRKNHVRAINREAMAALIAKGGLSEGAAQAVITVIAKNEIPHITIAY